MLFKLESHDVTSDWRFAIGLQTPYEPDRIPHCLLHIAGFGHHFWFKLPPIIKPKQKWVDLSHADWARVGRDGKKGYMDQIQRNYGFTVNNEALIVYYGIQPGNWTRDDPSNSDHSKVYFIPWNETHMVRHSFYNLDHSIFAQYTETTSSRDVAEKYRSSVPKIRISFNDFDGEQNVATCYIQERQWCYGSGWWKFIRYLKKPIVRRTLDITFDKETGRQKGDWKGGTIGTSIEIAPNESPLQAFIRYGCDTERSKGWGVVNREFANIKICQ